MSNSRYLLSRILLRCKAAAVRLRQTPTDRCHGQQYHHTVSRRPAISGSTRGLPFHHNRHAVCRARLPQRYSYSTSPIRTVTTSVARRYTPWYHEPWKVTAVAALSAGGVATAAHYRYREVVAFTNRTHLVLLSPEEDRELNEAEFNKFKEEHAGDILGLHHPDNLRVRRITLEIVLAIDRGLVIMNRKKPGIHPQTRHLHGLEWEVIVVRDDTVVQAKCLPGAGKIIVYTGLLNSFPTDVEIAVTLAHEGMLLQGTHPRWSTLLVIARNIPDCMRLLVLLALPFLRRDELEADRIGMLLFAAAGFNPRVVPLVWEKISRMEVDSRLQTFKHYFTVHPSSKKRKQILSQPQVMEEALELYRKVNASKNPEKVYGLFDWCITVANICYNFFG